MWTATTASHVTAPCVYTHGHAHLLWSIPAFQVVHTLLIPYHQSNAGFGIVFCLCHISSINRTGCYANVHKLQTLCMWDLVGLHSHFIAYCIQCCHMFGKLAESAWCVQVSSIRQEHHQPTTAEASTSRPTPPGSAKQQVHIKLPGNAKSTIPADMVLWTAGSSPASHAARKLKLPFETNQKGALMTDRNLRVLKQQRVFALGDVAGSEIEAETANIPPTAQVSPHVQCLSEMHE